MIKKYGFPLICFLFFLLIIVLPTFLNIVPVKNNSGEEIIVPEYIAENLDIICKDHYDYLNSIPSKEPLGPYREM